MAEYADLIEFSEFLPPTPSVTTSTGKWITFDDLCLEDLDVMEVAIFRTRMRRRLIGLVSRIRSAISAAEHSTPPQASAAIASLHRALYAELERVGL